MAMFEYNALTSAGRLMKGTIEAASRDEANAALDKMQLEVSSVEKAKTKRPTTPIGRSEFLLFNQQLASITKAGVPLERGLGGSLFLPILFGKTKHWLKILLNQVKMIVLLICRANFGLFLDRF